MINFGFSSLPYNNINYRIKLDYPQNLQDKRKYDKILNHLSKIVLKVNYQNI